MPRVRIELPPKFIFSTGYKVTIGDINYGNHLGNDKVLAIAQEARIQFFATLGITSELSVEGSTGIIMGDAAIVYRGEAFHGDELLVQIGVTDPGSHGFDMVYVISRVNDQAEIAYVKTGIVMFNYATRKISPLPAGFRSKMGL